MCLSCWTLYGIFLALFGALKNPSDVWLVKANTFHHFLVSVFISVLVSLFGLLTLFISHRLALCLGLAVIHAFRFALACFCILLRVSMSVSLVVRARESLSLTRHQAESVGCNNTDWDSQGVGNNATWKRKICNYAGRRTNFWDKKSSDFSGEIVLERNFGRSITAPTTLFPLIGCGVDSFSPN